MKILKFIEELCKVVVMGGLALMVILSIILVFNGYNWNQYWVLF